jgi:predicted dehydrogenase
MSLRIGIVDFDSSHCVEFTKRINHAAISEDQYVNGGRVVWGCPGASMLGPERVAGFTAQMQELGVRLVDDPLEMLGKVDAVMIESLDGSVHFQRARPFLEAGLPCFVDKPFASSLEQAKAMVELAGSRGAPIFSTSSLRYAPELVEFVHHSQAVESATGRILGAATYGPAPTRSRNPGLFHYGIHATEMLFALMGRDCEYVTCVRVGGEEGSETIGVEHVTGYWAGDRVGSVRGIRSGAAAYGFVAYCENAVRHVDVETEYIYRELLKRVMHMFQAGVPPLDPDETLRIMAFIEAARFSGNAGGMPVRLG